MDELGHLGGQGLPVVDQLTLGDELAHALAHHVDPEHRAVLLRNDLDGALGADDLALRVAAEVVDQLGDLVAPLLGDGRRDAHRGDLGVGVGDARHAGVVDRDGGEPRDVLGDEDALGEAGVRQLERRDQVADRVDAGHARLAELVDHDGAALDRDAGLLEAHAGGDGTTADGHQEQLGVEGLAALQRHDDAGVGGLHALEARAQLVLDAPAAEGALQELGAGLLLQREQVGEGLDDRDLGAERLPDGGELDADDAAAENDHRGRDAVELQRVVAGDDPLAVDVEAGKGLRHGAGRQHDAVTLDGLVAHDDAVGPRQPALALDDRDAPALEEALDALPGAVHDLVLEGVDAAHLDALEAGLDAHARGLTSLVGDLGRVQKRLCGDASPVQARAADLVLLDQRDGLA